MYEKCGEVGCTFCDPEKEMNQAEKLVAEFKEQLPEVNKKQEYLKDSLREMLDILSGDLWYADKVLRQEEVACALSDAYRNIIKAIDLIK